MPSIKQTFVRTVDLGNFNSATSVRDFFVVPKLQDIDVYVNGTLGVTVTVPQSSDIYDNFKLYKIKLCKLLLIPHVNVNAPIGTGSVNSLGLLQSAASELDPTDYGQDESAIESDATCRAHIWDKPFTIVWKPYIPFPVWLTGVGEYTADVVDNVVDFKQVQSVAYMSPWLSTYLAGLPNDLVEYSGYHLLMDATTTADDYSLRAVLKVWYVCKFPN